MSTTLDALRIFEACLQGMSHHVSRRPHDRERPDMIMSGNVFIYDERSSGIKRWTDGHHWSPSRIDGNFLIYRELLQPIRPRKPRTAPNPERSCSGSPSTDAELAYTDPPADSNSPDSSNDFKTGGLVKRTIRVVLDDNPFHLVAYYTNADVENGLLRSPSWDLSLGNVTPRTELMSQKTFRFPVEQEEAPLFEGQNPPLDGVDWNDDFAALAANVFAPVTAGDNGIPPGAGGYVPPAPGNYSIAPRSAGYAPPAAAQYTFGPGPGAYAPHAPGDYDIAPRAAGYGHSAAGEFTFGPGVNDYAPIGPAGYLPLGPGDMDQQVARQRTASASHWSIGADNVDQQVASQHTTSAGGPPLDAAATAGPYPAGYPFFGSLGSQLQGNMQAAHGGQFLNFAFPFKSG